MLKFSVPFWRNLHYCLWLKLLLSFWLGQFFYSSIYITRVLRGYTVEVDHELGVVVLGLGLETRNWGFRVFFFFGWKRFNLDSCKQMERNKPVHCSGCEWSVSKVTCGWVAMAMLILLWFMCTWDLQVCFRTAYYVWLMWLSAWLFQGRFTSAY